jgi:hypothetical protein
MNQILYEYELTPTTWVYISSLITLAVYFKFSRFWSVRNLDMFGLVCLAPGLLLLNRADQVGPAGYVWMFVVGGFFLIRLLIDSMMSRRPHLEPNLTPGALTFMGVSLLVFLMTNVITKDLRPVDLEGAVRADRILSRQPVPEASEKVAFHGPGYPFLHIPAMVPNRLMLSQQEDLSPRESRQALYMATVRTTAIMSHLAVVFGLAFIGYRHFGRLAMGIAAAALYLILPYTAQMVTHVDHALPGALIVWAIALYRRPLLSGMLIGLAIGSIFYPVFLLPLWISFYWKRGLYRFLGGVVVMLGVVIASLALTASDGSSFLLQFRSMFGWADIFLGHPGGFWAINEPAYRIPVMVAFAALSCSFALWPAQKNLGTLLSCSAVTMLGIQFWLSSDGGVYLAWYLPMLLLTIFRPNLDDRVALSVLGENRASARRGVTGSVDRAA